MSCPHVISLYTGAGGLDYGLEAAGFRVAACVENDPVGWLTIKKNRPSWKPVPDSIFDVTSRDLLNRAGLAKRQADLLTAGPPCQPFSKSGYWATGDSLRLDDPRADTLAAFVRVLEDTLPRAFLLENVEGLMYAGKDEAYRLLERRIGEINEKARTNYVLHKAVLNAADFGVPQVRKRVFIVASSDGAPFEFPDPTHRPAGDRPPGLFDEPAVETYRTAWDALADVRPDPDECLDVNGKWAGLLPSIPEGSNYLHHTDRGEGYPLFGWRRKYWSFLLKLAKNRPSWTIQAHPGPAIGPFHWENRRLSARELCRLQTFPDRVRIYGSRLDVQRQIGNAVPSLLGEVLGRSIREQLLGGRKRHTAPKLLPRKRDDTPPPEPVGPVPEPYLAQLGDHAAHPGTGKGYGAIRRQTEP